MPICHEKKIIFVHIPKTGGTSVESVLGMHGRRKDIGIRPYKEQKKDYSVLYGDGLQHLTLEEIYRFFDTCRFSDYEQWGDVKRLVDRIFNKLSIPDFSKTFLAKDYFKFSIVRNPYERLLSYYSWSNGGWYKGRSLDKSSFTRFVEKIKNEVDISKNSHLRLQKDYLLISGVVGVDRILRTENLDDEFRSVAQELGVTASLPKRMVTERKEAEYYYDSYARRLVAELYSEDFELFNYSK